MVDNRPPSKPPNVVENRHSSYKSDLLDILQKVPTYLSGLVFFLSESIPPSKISSYSRFIVAFGGSISTKFGEVTHYLCNERWSFDSLASKHTKIKFLKYEWFDRCLKEEKLVGVDAFLVRPNS